jgi:type VI secretion system protein ImpG
MDPRLAELFETELHHLREVASEFARGNAKVSGRLDLDVDPKHLSRDPYVNMLLQGSAFMAARVHYQLELEFPRFTQSLLEVIYPDFLCSTPSMAIVSFEPEFADQSLARGFEVPRGTLLRSHLGKGEHTACTFQTAHSLTLWPIQLSDVHYFTTRTLEQLGLPGSLRARSAFRFSLTSTAGLTFKQIGLDPATQVSSLDSLSFHIRDDGQGFLRGPGRIACLIYEQLFANASSVIIRFGKGNQRKDVILPASAIRPVGFSDSEALLPVNRRTFQGYRFLKEYFAFPDRLLYFDIVGLREALQDCNFNQVELFILLDDEDLKLEGFEPGSRDRPAVNRDRFALYTTPCINLFPHEFDPVTLSDRSCEYQVIVDRTRSLDYEVYSVDRVTGYGSRPEERLEFRPFYASKDLDERLTGFYALYREKRPLTTAEKEFGRHPGYLGSQVFLSLVDAASAPLRPGLKRLSIAGLCTNRHLPSGMARNVQGTDFVPLEISGPFQSSIRCISGPTEPVASASFGRHSWELINHLALNFQTLIDSNEKEGAAALRNLLLLYLGPNQKELRRQVEGLRSASVKPITRRVPTDGPITYAQGIEVTLLFDEEEFTGSGCFVLGCVIERFLSRYVSLNSFVETVISSLQRPEIKRWPARMGTRAFI